jgi:AcrR family transcriptional regulator
VAATDRERSDSSRRRLRQPERRQRILDSARAALAERGPDGVSMGEIADRAGVTRSVLYDHSPSKERLLLAVIEEHHAQFMLGLRAVGDRRPLDEPTFAALVASYIAQAEADPVGWRILCLERAYDPELAAYQAATAAEVDEWLTDMLPTGGPRSERRAIARALRAAMDEFVAARRDNPRIARQTLIGISVGLWRGVTGACD